MLGLTFAPDREAKISKTKQISRISPFGILTFSNIFRAEIFEKVSKYSNKYPKEKLFLGILASLPGASVKSILKLFSNIFSVILDLLQTEIRN